MMVAGASSMEMTFVRIFLISTLPLWMSSIASSNSPALVRAPRISTSFFVIRSVGSGVSVFGHPVRVILPALLTRSRVERIAAFAPLHSITCCAITPFVISLIRFTVSSVLELITYSMPSSFANCRRSSTRSSKIA